MSSDGFGRDYAPRAARCDRRYARHSPAPIRKGVGKASGFTSWRLPEVGANNVKGDTAYFGDFQSSIDRDDLAPLPLGNGRLVDPEPTGEFRRASHGSDDRIKRGPLRFGEASHTTQYSVASPSGKHIILPREAALTPTMSGVQTAILTQADHQRASGERLRRLIKLLGISYVEAAELMNVSKHVLNHWMQGNHPIQPYSLYRLCRAKGANFDYVFLGDWSALPHRMGRELEAELLSYQGPVAVSARKGV